MDPLPQYGSHAFIPYFDSSTSLDAPLTLLNTSTWTYCGPLLTSSATSLPPSFHTWVSSTIRGPFLPRLLPFLRFLHGFLSQAGTQHYWLTIRATRPTSKYDTTRWHTDDLFFDHDGEKDRVEPGHASKRRKSSRRRKRKEDVAKRTYWKLATTLLGPSTLFLKDGMRARHTQRAAKRAECAKQGEHTCTQFRCLGCLDAVEAVRQTLAAEFAHEEVERPQYGEVAFFRLGDEEGAVHSEPACREDRIFVNVVPGTEEELKALMGRWGLSFPRAWCFGVPVAFDDDKLETVRGDSPLENESSDVDTISETRSSTSNMSMNMREEYSEWLEEKGFHFAEVFGQKGGAVGACGVRIEISI
jgi:hypothetical protein